MRKYYEQKKHSVKYKFQKLLNHKFICKFKPLSDTACEASSLNKYFKNVKRGYTERYVGGDLHRSEASIYSPKKPVLTYFQIFCQLWGF